MEIYSEEFMLCFRLSGDDIANLKQIIEAVNGYRL